jgi:hypothetical protein
MARAEYVDYIVDRVIPIPNINKLPCGNHDFQSGEYDVFKKNTIKIDPGFLNVCDLIEKIDMSSYNQLQTVDNNFANNCGRLDTISFKNCRKLSIIGSEFAESCSELKMIDLSGCRNLSFIGKSFALNCQNLEIVDLSSCGSCWLREDHVISAFKDVFTKNLKHVYIDDKTSSAITTFLNREFPDNDIVRTF